VLVGEHPRSAEYLLDPEQVPQLSLVFALLDLDAHFLVVVEALHVIFEQRELVHLFLRPLSAGVAFVMRTCRGEVLCPPESLESIDLLSESLSKWLEELLTVLVFFVVVRRDVDCCGVDFGTFA